MHRLHVTFLFVFGASSVLAETLPGWVRRTPPPDATFAWFVGHASSQRSEQEARDGAVRVAIAEALAFLGQDVKSDLLLRQSETNGTSEQHVSLEISVHGRVRTLRGIGVAETCVEERGGTSGPRTWEAHALVRQLLSELAAARAEDAARIAAELEDQRRRALAAAQLHHRALAQRDAGDLPEALVAWREARGVLAALPPSTPVDEDGVASAGVLLDRIDAEVARAAEHLQQERRTVAVLLDCSGGNENLPCDDAPFVEVATSAGFRSSRAAAGDPLTRGVLAGDAAAVRALADAAHVHYVLVVRLEHSGLSGGAITTARARGSFSILDAATGSVVDAGRPLDARGAGIDGAAAHAAAFKSASDLLRAAIRGKLRQL